MRDSSEPSIRSASPQDLPIIGKLARSIWPRAYGDILSQKQIDYMLDLFYKPEALEKQFESQRFLLVSHGGSPVGFASYSSDRDSQRTKLHKLYVVQNLQGKGLGKALLMAVVDLARADGSTQLVLNVNRQNKAIDFYEKLGFTKISEEDIDIGKGYWMNDFVMSMRIA